MEMDIEQRRQSVVQTHTQFYRLILALGEAFGLDQVLEVVARWRFDEGKRIGEMLKEELGITGDTPEDFLKIWQEHGKQVGIEAEILKDEDGNIIFRHRRVLPVPDCHWQDQGPMGENMSHVGVAVHRRDSTRSQS